MDNLYVYERIGALCKAYGVSVTQMCKEVGVPRSALSDYKAGRIKSLSADKLSRIAAYFNVSMENLLGIPSTAHVDKIEEQRKLYGLTQEDLAAKTGISLSNIRHYELGNKKPNLKNLGLIADALDISIESILNENGSYFELPIEAGMVGTLDWYARKNGRTVYEEVNIAVNDYLDYLTSKNFLDDDINANALDRIDISLQNAILRIIGALDDLNDAGRQRAVEYVEELAEVPKYQCEDVGKSPPTRKEPTP